MLVQGELSSARLVCPAVELKQGAPGALGPLAIIGGAISSDALSKPMLHALLPLTCCHITRALMAAPFTRM